MIHVE
jgi:uncharacterized protein (DUF433 family)/predicted nuclease of predicted toxin-antitoxin system